MPHTRSAAKRLRQSKKNNTRNRDVRNAFKTYMKRVMAAVKAGDLAKAKAELPETMRKIDKAAKAHAIHHNNAARKKAQVARAVATLEKKGAKPK